MVPLRGAARTNPAVRVAAAGDGKDMLNIRNLPAVFAVALTSVGHLAGPVMASVSDYRFELVKADPAGPATTKVMVRLLHVPDGKPVPDAVIFETRADMGPSGMAAMSGAVTPLPPAPGGLYPFQVETGMAGGWALNLAAKIQGEAGTLRAAINFTAGP